MFISFEGPEGCGKSTHTKLLKEYLESRGKKVVLTFEPGGTKLGEELRKMLLHARNKIDRITELAMFAADRAEHVSKVIIPALEHGQWVICDRYVDSTLAYQIAGRGLPEDMVRYMNMVSCHGVLPDLTFLLDILPTLGLERAGKIKKADRFEKEKTTFHNRVRQRYLEIAKNEPKRIRVIDTGKNTVKQVQAIIQKIIQRHI
ncbi:MAG: dTMP kinase [Candidatus Margulisbacteria bacterium]|nr:dTMP kinase [Candidatus Margulisiibacteriota bacterium]